MHGDKPIQKYLNCQLYTHFYDLWFKLTLNQWCLWMLAKSIRLCTLWTDAAESEKKELKNHITWWLSTASNGISHVTWRENIGKNQDVDFPHFIHTSNKWLKKTTEQYWNVWYLLLYIEFSIFVNNSFKRQILWISPESSISYSVNESRMFPCRETSHMIINIYHKKNAILKLLLNSLKLYSGVKTMLEIGKILNKD